MTKKLTATEKFERREDKLHLGFVARFEELKLLYPELTIFYDGCSETTAKLHEFGLHMHFYTEPVNVNETVPEPDAGPVQFLFEIDYRFNAFRYQLHKDLIVDGRERIHLLRNRKVVSCPFKNSVECNIAWADKVQAFIRSHIDNVSKFKQGTYTASYTLKGK
jgi:hypothetical protein